MSEARKKLEVLYEDGLGDIDAIVKRLEKLSDDTGNLTTAINKFNNAEVLMDKKIDDLNSVTKLFNKNIYIALACTFLFTAVIGAVSGYILFKEELQTKVFENELKKVTDARLDFEKQQTFMVLAKRSGVIFGSNAIILPTKECKTAAPKNNCAYFYPETFFDSGK